MKHMRTLMEEIVAENGEEWFYPSNLIAEARFLCGM